MINKIYLTIIWLLLSTHASLAAGTTHLLWWTWDESTFTKLRNWTISTKDIPDFINWAINFLMWFAWTIAIIFIIIWGYKIALWSLEQDKTKWKETIFMALSWFAVAWLAYVIIQLIIDNFS